MHNYGESANLPLLKVNMRSVLFRRQIQRNRHDGVKTEKTFVEMKVVKYKINGGNRGKVHTTILCDAVSVAEKAFY